jgi:hypothetical protein
VKIEVGKKYTDGRDVVEIKFIDWEGSGWGLTDERKSCRYIKTYDTAWTEVIDKPDPGEGWRLLHPDEDVESGDQYYLRFSDPFENWATAKCSNNKQTPGMFYRRRIAPQYVPYTWDDREELRGRWFRRKVKDTYEHERLAWRFDLVDGYFYVDSTRSDELLNEWVWLDGSPCGRKVV